MTIYNQTNNYFEEIKKNADEYGFVDDVISIKYGGYALGFEWEYIDKLLNCFVDTEDFDLRFDSDNRVYYVQGKCGKAQKKKFEKFIATGEDE